MNKYLAYLLAVRVRKYKKPPKASALKKEKGILLICRHPLGDTVTESPLLYGLRKAYPNYWITLVCSKENFNLLECCPYADEVIPYSSKTNKSFLKENLKRTYQFAEEYFACRKYELALIPSSCMPALIEAWLVHFSGAERRVTYSEKFNTIMHKEYMGAYDAYFTDSLFDDQLKHEVERNLDLLKVLGLNAENESLELWTNESDQERVRSLFREEDISEEILRVIVNLSTSAKSKDWPVENYIEVCAKLNRKYSLEYILIGAGETAEEYANIFKEHIHNVHDFVGVTTIRQTIEIMRHADMYLGGDTGPMHFAAACKLGGVAIYKVAKNIDNKAENFASRLYPWQADIKVVQPAQALAGCEHGCNLGIAHCIKSITVNEVLEKMEKSIEDTKR